MCSGIGQDQALLPGFPIRKSSDHSSVGSFPRLIAASYVLHRLLVPRHPPCALTNLATKMLASTVQFSRNGRASVVVTACGVRRIASSYAVVRRDRAQPPQRPERLPRERVSFGPHVVGLEVTPQPVAWWQVPSGPNSVLGALVCS